jgi:hypothetical protein
MDCENLTALSDHNMSIIAFSKLDIERKGVSDSCPRQSYLSISVLRDTELIRYDMELMSYSS